MQYKDFVKSMFEKHRGKMPAKDIMKLAAQEWSNGRDGKMAKMPKMPKGKKAMKGKGITGGGETGGSILGDILGFGMEKKQAKQAKPKAKRKPKQEKGAGIFSDLGSALGSIGAVMDPIVSLASGRKNMVGGSMGGKMEKMKAPKNPNPKRLSTFYNTENLPESNYQMNVMPSHGGTLLMNSGKGQPAGMAMGGMATGGGILDNIMPLLPFAFL